MDEKKMMSYLPLWQKISPYSFCFVSLGDTILFFGCRNKNGDDFFRDEWENIKNENIKIYTCYSRDQVFQRSFLFYNITSDAN